MREGIIVMVCIGLVLLLILNRGKDTPEEQRQFQEVGSAPATHHISGPVDFIDLEYWDKQIEKAHIEGDSIKIDQARIEKDLAIKALSDHLQYKEALGRASTYSDSLIN